jgi:hypothetical protein
VGQFRRHARALRVLLAHCSGGGVSNFAAFFRYATEAQKRRVFLRVLRAATKRQLAALRAP